MSSHLHRQRVSSEEPEPWDQELLCTEQEQLRSPGKAAVGGTVLAHPPAV